MNPALSIVFFTTLIGGGQGLVVALAAATLAGARPGTPFLLLALAVAIVLLLAGLAASFLHLGHKRRAWRAVLMWRTSWMSREVIVLPAFIAWVALWLLGVATGASASSERAIALVAIVLALALFHCTAMIYASLRFIQEWAHPLTVVNLTLIGLSSGLVLAGALGTLGGESGFARGVAPHALATTLAAWAGRMLALRRNAALRPKSTLQSATGIRSPRVVQMSMGMTGGSFNTREFFHGHSPALLARVRAGFVVLGFALPSAVLAGLLMGLPAGAWAVAALLQYLGLLAERWFFFAQANHPQNLYYQTVS